MYLFGETIGMSDHERHTLARCRGDTISDPLLRCDPQTRLFLLIRSDRSVDSHLGSHINFFRYSLLPIVFTLIGRYLALLKWIILPDQLAGTFEKSPWISS